MFGSITGSVRKSGVLSEFDLFGIDQDELASERGMSHQQCMYDSVQSNGLATACGSGNQKMRTFSKIFERGVDLSGWCLILGRY
jgi:hypothetical protein